MKELVFLQVVPHDDYFLWQIEVQIVNFRKFDISKKMEICVWHRKDSTQIHKWQKLERKYPEVKFFYYEDQGIDAGLYIPQLRPHTLRQHFRFRSSKNTVYFYHDSDIIFNYLPDFQKLMDDEIGWQSDCSSYLDYDYLQRKEVEGNIPDNLAIKKLAEIGHVSVDKIKSYTGKTGGAQTILKGIDSEFWKDVERMCMDIRNAFFYGRPNSINKQYFDSESAGFQSWCADMWALNFAQWNRGMKTDVTTELDFSWATSGIEEFHKKPIFHNAGALKGGGLFYKGEWINKSPIGQEIPLPGEETASLQYVKAIMEVT